MQRAPYSFAPDVTEKTPDELAQLIRDCDCEPIARTEGTPGTDSGGSVDPGTTGGSLDDPVPGPGDGGSGIGGTGLDPIIEQPPEDECAFDQYVFCGTTSLSDADGIPTCYIKVQPDSEEENPNVIFVQSFGTNGVCMVKNSQIACDAGVKGYILGMDEYIGIGDDCDTLEQCQNTPPDFYLPPDDGGTSSDDVTIHCPNSLFKIKPPVVSSPSPCVNNPAGDMTLSWTAPTTYADGRPLPASPTFGCTAVCASAVCGYHVRILGQSSFAVVAEYDTGPGVTSVTFEATSLPDGDCLAGLGYIWDVYAKGNNCNTCDSFVSDDGVFGVSTAAPCSCPGGLADSYTRIIVGTTTPCDGAWVLTTAAPCLWMSEGGLHAVYLDTTACQWATDCGVSGDTWIKTTGLTPIGTYTHAAGPNPASTCVVTA